MIYTVKIVRVQEPNRAQMGFQIGSARKLARRTLEHDAYRWICGGVQLNCPTLADFRSQSGEALDGLLTENIACTSGHGPMSSFGAERRTNPFVADGV